MRTWDLASGERTRCLLDFRDLRPDDDWYKEQGLWDEEDDVPLIWDAEPDPAEMLAARRRSEGWTAVLWSSPEVGAST